MISGGESQDLFFWRICPSWWNSWLKFVFAESGSVSAMGRRMTIRRDTLKLLGRRRSTVVAEMRRRYDCWSRVPLPWRPFLPWRPSTARRRPPMATEPPLNRVGFSFARSSVHLTARGGSISSGHRDSFATASNDHYDWSIASIESTVPINIPTPYFLSSHHHSIRDNGFQVNDYNPYTYLDEQNTFSFIHYRRNILETRTPVSPCRCEISSK